MDCFSFRRRALLFYRSRARYAGHNCRRRQQSHGSQKLLFLHKNTILMLLYKQYKDGIFYVNYNLVTVQRQGSQPRQHVRPLGFDIFVVGAHLIDELPIHKLHDSVGDSLDKLMVV